MGTEGTSPPCCFLQSWASHWFCGFGGCALTWCLGSGLSFPRCLRDGWGAGCRGCRGAGVAGVLGHLRVQGVMSAGGLGVQGCLGVCKAVQECWLQQPGWAVGRGGCQDPRAMPQKPTIPTWRTRHHPKAQLPRRMFLRALCPACCHRSLQPSAASKPPCFPPAQLWGLQGCSRCVCAGCTLALLCSPPPC